MNHGAVRWTLFVAFALVVIAVFVGTLFPGVGRWLPFHAPLITHLLVFMVVGVLARLVVPAKQRALPRALALAAGLGIAAESLQLAVPARSFTMLDLFANLGGAVVGVVLASLVLVVLARMRFGPAADGG